MSDPMDDAIVLPERSAPQSLKAAIDTRIDEHLAEHSEPTDFLADLPALSPPQAMHQRLSERLLDSNPSDFLESQLSSLPSVSPDGSLQRSIQSRLTRLDRRGVVQFERSRWMPVAAAALLAVGLTTLMLAGFRSLSLENDPRTYAQVDELRLAPSSKLNSDPILYRPIRTSDALVYATVQDSLHIVPLLDAGESWEHAVGARLWAPLASSAGIVFYITAMQRLTALDVSTKRELFEVQVPPTELDKAPVVAGGAVWLQGVTGQLIRIHQRQGSLLGETDTPFNGMIRLVHHGDTVWAVDELSGQAAAYDASTGNRKTSKIYSLATEELASGPYFVEGAVVSSAFNGRIEVRSTDERVLWVVSGEGLATEPLGFENKLLVLGFDGLMRQFDLETGSLNWATSLELPESDLFSPTLTLQDDQLYVVDRQRTGAGQALRVLDWSSGELKSDVSLQGFEGSANGILFDRDQGVFVLDNEGALHHHQIVD